MPNRILVHALLFVVAITLTGYAQAVALKRNEGGLPSLSGKRVLLMTPDIELSELTVGGMLEPKADWTGLAQKHVGGALRKEMDKRKMGLRTFKWVFSWSEPA